MLLHCISNTSKVARVQKVRFVMNRVLAVVYLLVFTRKAWLLWSLRSDVGREDKLVKEHTAVYICSGSNQK